MIGKWKLTPGCLGVVFVTLLWSGSAQAGITPSKSGANIIRHPAGLTGCLITVCLMDKDDVTCGQWS